MLSVVIDRLAEAIAWAEGFYIDGSRAQRNHNPGDLTLDITGTGSGLYDGQFVIYPTDADGWAALKKQVEMMLTDTSGIYNSAMTIAQVAAKYTVTEAEAWAANVAARLGVTPDTVIGDLEARIGGAAAGGAALLLLIGLVLLRRWLV